MQTAAKSIVWIASYPKSGNTWLRFLLCNLIFGCVDSAAVLNRLAPDVHELNTAAAPPAERTLMKTHFAWSTHLPFGAHTRCAIYVVREPADVMLSNFFYAYRSGAQGAAAAAAFDRYVDDYIAAGGDPRWLSLGMGRWDDNVRTWIGVNHTFPVLGLRYEDLLSDGVGSARTVCRFLGLERTDAQVAAAVAGASFERMREIEETDIRQQRIGIFYKPYLRTVIDSGARFMRRGASGESRTVLSNEQRVRFDARFGELRRQLGYV